MFGDRGVKFCAVSSFVPAAALAVSLSLGAIFMSPAASAADIYEGPSFKDTPVLMGPAMWRGLYVGGHIGGAWGDVDVKDKNEWRGKDPDASVSFNNSGFMGGGQIGYNFQSGRLVYGLEADIGKLDISGKSSMNAMNHHVGPNWVNSKYSVSTGLYGDITGRLGYAANRNLFYVKGGAAFLSIDAKAHYKGGSDGCRESNKPCDWNIFPAEFDFGKSDTNWGWTIGAGVEHSLSSSWSIKAEYQHFDFGTMSYDYTGQINHSYNNHYKNAITTVNGKTDISATADAVTVGVNYHLGR